MTPPVLQGATDLEKQLELLLVENQCLKAELKSRQSPDAAAESCSRCPHSQVSDPPTTTTTAASHLGALAHKHTWLFLAGGGVSAEGGAALGGAGPAEAAAAGPAGAGGAGPKLQPEEPPSAAGGEQAEAGGAAAPRGGAQQAPGHASPGQGEETARWRRARGCRSDRTVLLSRSLQQAALLSCRRRTRSCCSSCVPSSSCRRSCRRSCTSPRGAALS